MAHMVTQPYARGLAYLLKYLARYVVADLSKYLAQHLGFSEVPVPEHISEGEFGV